MTGTNPSEDGNEEPERITDVANEPPTQPRGHIPLFLPASLRPEASGSVPTALAEISKETQRALANEIYAFLQSESPVLARLNEGTACYIGVVSVPKTKKVRVVYGFGLGATPIGRSVSPTDGKLLVLQGDGNAELGPPVPMCLPADMVTENIVAAMTTAQFSSQLHRRGTNYSYPLLSRRAVTDTVETMMLAPVPAYLVYDGFEDDVDAALLLERVMTNEVIDTDCGDHLEGFLRACLSSHNAGDSKPYVTDASFSAPAPTKARQWARETFKKLFPSLNEQGASSQAQAPTTAPGGHDLASLVAAITAATSSAGTTIATSASTAKDATAGNMSEGELTTLLRMCGGPRGGNIEDLPSWFKECTDKANSEAFKAITLQKHVMATTYYDDAEVPLTGPLLKMILKRAWTGKDGNINRPSLIHAMDGLTPFAMLDLNEDQVAILNEEQDLLNTASLVSVSDLRGQRSKLKVTIPAEPEEFMLMIKRYTNLVYAIFSEDSPLFKALVAVIRALKDLSRDARRRMTLPTKGSILWILLLQSRQFALGEVSLLCEFTTMHEDLRAKKASILHSEMPRDLLENSESAQSDKPTKERESPPEIDVDKIPKKPRVPNPNNWNPTLKEKLEGPLKEAGFPSFTKVMNFCKTDAYSVFPKGSPVCVPNAFFGRCFNGDKCPRKHTPARDSQVDSILKIVAPFLKEPAKLKTGQ